MNKRLVLSLLFLCMSSACTSSVPQTNEEIIEENIVSMIQPTDFEYETEKMLRVLGDEMSFFDFQVNNEIQSITLSSVAVSEEENDTLAKQTFDIKKEYDLQRIGFRFYANTAEVIYMTEGTSAKISHTPDLPIFDDEYHFISSVWLLEEPAEIIAEQTMPLWQVFGKDEEGNYNKVIEYSVTFYQDKRE